MPRGFYDRYADVPIVHLSGWYDPYARTAMENYVGLSRVKRSRMQLVLGPWTHGDRSSSYAGEVEFGPAAAVDGNLAEDFFELRRRWFDRWIKGLANGIDEQPPVRVFVMGGGSGRRNRDGRLEHGGYWRSAAEWPLLQTRWTKLYLHADRSPFRSTGSGLGCSRIYLRSARSNTYGGPGRGLCDHDRAVSNRKFVWPWAPPAARYIVMHLWTSFANGLSDRWRQCGSNGPVPRR